MHILPAHIAEPAGIRRRRWPVTAGIPFPRGEVRSANQINLRGPRGDAPCHSEVLARWADGSVRWALIEAQVDVEASSRTEYTLQYGADVKAAPPEPAPLRSTDSDGSIAVETGAASISIGRRGGRLFTGLIAGDRQLLTVDDAEPQLQGIDAADQTPFHGEISDAVLEEENPLRSVVRADGVYVTDRGDILLSWTIRMHFFAHHSFVKLHHTLIHDQTTRPTVLLGALRLSIPVTLEGPLRQLMGSVAETAERSGPRSQRDPAAQDLDAPVGLLQSQPNCHQVTGHGAEQTLTRSSNCLGWIHLSDPGIGITAKLVRPWQNSPMALSTDGSRLDVHLYPDSSQPGLAHMSGARVPAVELRQGVAKTHEVALHAGPPCARFLEADRVAVGLEHPLLLSLPSAHWAETAVFGPFQPFRESLWPLETRLRSWSQVPADFGFLGFGRVSGAGETTTAFGLVRSLLFQYLRTQDQSLFWRAQALAIDAMDAGVCHFHADRPEWRGGPYPPGQIGTAAPGTEFAGVDGLIDFYFLTGYRRAREVAAACADFCRRVAPYEWRETLGAEGGVAGTAGTGLAGFGALPRVGNALKVMADFYAAFPEEHLLRSMEALVDLLEGWQDADGRWSHPIGHHRAGAEPALTASVLQGLTGYYEASGDERARRMAKVGALFLARHGRTAEGLFYRQQSPAAERPCLRSLALLPALSETYEQTGDPVALDAGYRMFRWAVDGDAVETAHLQDLIAFMPLLEREQLLQDYTEPVDALGSTRQLWPRAAAEQRAGG